MEQQTNTKMSVNKWLLTFLIIIIPIVNLIALLVWAYGDDKDEPRKEYAKAMLIFVGCMALLGGVLRVLMPTTQSAKTTSSAVVSNYTSNTDEVTKDIEIIETSIGKVDGFTGRYIVGKLKNNSSTTAHTHFTVECNVYDNDNTILQTVRIRVNNKVPPGETLKFNQDTSSDLIMRSAVSVKVIRCYSSLL